jgi:nucleoside transporter
MNQGIRTKLSIMMFLEYFVWGAWAVALGTYLLSLPTSGGLDFTGTETGWIYTTTAIGAMISPLFIGLIADRLFSTEKVIAVLHIAGAGLLGWAAYTCTQGSPEIDSAFKGAAKEVRGFETGSLLDAIDREQSLERDVKKATGEEKDLLEKSLKEFKEKNDKSIQEAIDKVKKSPAVMSAVGNVYWPLLLIMIGYAVCYMPTLTLTNSISFRNLSNPDNQFGAIRVLGTIGWIVAGLVVGLRSLIGSSDNPYLINEVSPQPLYLAAGASILLGLFSFTLPHTPPAGGAKTLGETLGLPALQMLRETSFLVFAICAFLIQIALAFYYAFANKFLTDLHALSPTAIQTIGQVSEIFFMLLIPVGLARLGTKWMLVLGMLAWCARYAIFAWQNVPAVISIGLPLHGICYDFFFVVAYLYVDRQAPSNLRASAQGLITFITLGVGWFLGNLVGGWVVDQFTQGATTDWTKVWSVPLACAAVCTVAFIALFRPPANEGKPPIANQGLEVMEPVQHPA